MSKTTTNLGLIKPERSDNYSVDVMSENMDIIDARVGTLEKNISFDSNGNIVGNLNGFSTGVFVNAKYTDALVNGYGVLCGNTTGEQTTSVSAGTSSNANSSRRTSATITVGDYSRDSLSFPLKLAPGLYLKDESNIVGDMFKAKRKVTCTMGVVSGQTVWSGWSTQYYCNGTLVLTISDDSSGVTTRTITVNAGDTLYCTANRCATATMTVHDAENSLYLVAD